MGCKSGNNAKMSILDQHWDKWVPEPNTGCYLWIGGITGTRGKRPYLAAEGGYVARLVCEETNGPPPFPRAEAAHKKFCSNGMCVNGDHIYWASRSQNEFDKPLELRRAAWKTNHPSWRT